jgi:type II secretory pathway pseudopilin PulG
MRVRFQNHHLRERGYILLTLMLFVALLTIGFLAIIQRIDTQIKRDREEELIHRGVQYSRAVRRYFKKFGRYPNTVEQLEDTNNYRSLRKRYKDPITGKDFKPLHMTDVQMSFVAGGAGGLPPGLAANVSTAGGLNGVAAMAGGVGQNPTAAQNPQGGADQSAASDTSPTGQQAGGNGAVSKGNDASSPGQQVFGGGAIVGVASVSKDKTIREFNKKDHYNQWQFIYDPTTDRGGLLMTPNQPPLKGATPLNPQNGAQPTPGQNQGPGTGPGAGTTPQQPSQPPDQ